MARKEAKRFKALYFDLRIKDLEDTTPKPGQRALMN